MEPIPEYDRHLKNQPGHGGGKPPWQRDPLDSLKHLAVVLALVAGAVAGVWGIYVAIQAATGPPVMNKLLSEAVSPDGQWRAVTVLHASPPPLFTGVLIQDAARRADPNVKTLIFAQEFELPLRLRWDGPRVLTVFVPADAPNAGVLRQANLYEGIKINYQPVKMFSDQTLTSATK